MNFEKLAEIWNASDSSSESNIKLNRSLIREISRSKIKSGLAEIKWTSIIELVVGIIWNIFLIHFIFAHSMEWKYVIPAVILLAISIFGLALDIYKLDLIHSVNSNQSVLQTQRRLERLRLIERMDNFSLLVVIPLFAVPFIIVMAQALFGIDMLMIEQFQERLVAFCIGTGIVAAIITILLFLFPDKQLNDSINFLKELKETD